MSEILTDNEQRLIAFNTSLWTLLKPTRLQAACPQCGKVSIGRQGRSTQGAKLLYVYCCQRVRLAIYHKDTQVPIHLSDLPKPN